MNVQLDNLFALSASVKNDFVELVLAGNGGCGVHHNFASVIDRLNEMFEIISDIDKSERYLSAFHKVTRKSWFLKIEDILVPFPGRDMITMPAYDTRTVPLEDQTWSKWLISHTNQINGFTSINNTWIILRSMYPNTFGDCPIVQKYAYYLDVLSDGRKNEPYVEQGSGNFFNKSVDSALGQRAKLAINCAMEWLRPNQPLPLDIIEEAFDYMFIHLAEGALDIKKWKYPFVISWFTESNRGVCIQWDAAMESPIFFDKKDKPTGFIADSNRTALDEGFESMLKAGLPRLAAFCMKMLSVKVEPRWHAAGSAMVFFEGLFGFLRENFAVSIKGQIDDSNQRNIDLKEQLENPGYEQEYRDLIRDFANNINWDTESDYHAKAASYMTTRSAGLFDADALDPDALGATIQEHINSIQLEADGRKMIFKMKDKQSAYLYDPQAMHDAPIDNVYDLEHPGRVGLRSVGSRHERAIFMGKVHTQLKEGLIAAALESFSGALRYDSTNEKSYVTTTQRDTGRAFTDHGSWAYASSRMEDDFVVLMQDFSSLDQTSKFMNARRFWIESFEEIFGSGARTSPTVDGKPAHQHLIDFWRRIHQAKFVLPSGPDRKKDFIILSPDMLLSGEFITRYFNDMTTYAFFLYAERKMVAENEHFQITELRIQGDDMIEVRRLSGAFKSWSDAKKTEFLTKYKERRAELAKECALDINPTKFLTSTIMFEFLKKMMVLGVFWPRYMQAALGQNESERVDRTVPPIQRMIARIGQHREYIFRGGPFIETMMRTYLEWNLIRSVNLSQFKRSLIPFPVLFTPLMDGGVGALPWSILDPNVDVLLRQIAWPTRIRALVHGWALAGKKKGESSVKVLAEAATEKLSAAVSWVSEHSNKQAFEGSVEASRVLAEEYGYKDPVPYHSRAWPMIKQTFEDAPQFNNFRIADKRRDTISMLEFLVDNFDAIANDELEIEPHPLSELSFIVGEVSGMKIEHPFIAGLDNVVDRWTRDIGSSSRNNSLSVDMFRTLKGLITESSIPSNLSDNMADSLAKTIIENKFTTAASIALLLLSRGAGDKPSRVQAVAEILAKNVSQLRFVADISNFSIVGEGFTDKSRKNVHSFVEVAEPFASMQSFESDIIYTIGFQYVRNLPLYDTDGNYVERRKVKVDVSNELVASMIVRNYGFKPTTAFYNFRDPTLDQEL